MTQKYRMNEIGSEYWLENEVITKKYEIGNNSKNIFLLSGRTAIDYALTIIEKNGKVNKVYFPSYCCQSMLQPFLERNIEIIFYDVSFKNGNFIYDIDCNMKCDIFFAMNYFGFSHYNMDYYIEQFKKRNITVIEDSTHSILSKRRYNQKSDFVIASLRKWFPIISGGILINQSNIIIDTEKTKNKNERYVSLKEKAMQEKFKYIETNNGDIKEQFLQKFSEANNILKDDYKNYLMDNKSYSILKNININNIILKRKNNVKTIYEYLKNQEKIQYLKYINLEEDCPIFVPIFLDKNKRENLKNYLIENKVYCPNHWGIPEKIEKENQKKIYNMELSLICDQRYEKKDIKMYMDLIKHKEL